MFSFSMIQRGKTMETNKYLVSLFKIIKDMESLDLFSDAAKLSKTEFRLVREIVMEGKEGRSIISSELARRLGITRSAVSQVVTKLEQRDVVKRTAAPVDRKIAYIRLSDRSMAIFEEQCKQANAIIEAVVNDLGEEKVQRLIAEYEEFSAALDRAREAASHTYKKSK